MRSTLFALLFLLALPIAAQDRVKLYDDMCDPLQAAFCDYVRDDSQTSYISNAAGEYIGTLIDYKFYGWGVFFSSNGIQSYGQYRNGRLLFGLLYLNFRHSLCHGWASGPCPFLSHFVLGVQALSPDTYEVKPNLAYLDWARGTYPTPCGNIEVDVKKVDGELVVDIKAPHGINIVR